MNSDTAAQVLEEIQKRFPDLTPELATKTLLAESLKTCKNIIDLSKLPIDPRVLNDLLKLQLIDEKEWKRIMDLIDPR